MAQRDTYLAAGRFTIAISGCSDFFKVFLRSSVVPSSLKTAVVNHSSTVQNYRPISNLSVLSKLLECIVCDQLQSFVENVVYYTMSLVSVQTLPSTETALIKEHSDLVPAIDPGNQAALATLHMSAAFDTVDHAIRYDTIRQ